MGLSTEFLTTRFVRQTEMLENNPRSGSAINDGFEKCAMLGQVVSITNGGRNVFNLTSPNHDSSLFVRTLHNKQDCLLCTECREPIIDQFCCSIEHQYWHQSCLRCVICSKPLSIRCYARDGRLFCRDDFMRFYGPKCTGCHKVIQPSDLVQFAKSSIFHAKCFRCTICERQFTRGDQCCFARGDQFIICHEHYLASMRNDASQEMANSTTVSNSPFLPNDVQPCVPAESFAAGQLIPIRNSPNADLAQNIRVSTTGADFNVPTKERTISHSFKSGSEQWGDYDSPIKRRSQSESHNYIGSMQANEQIYCEHKVSETSEDLKGDFNMLIADSTRINCSEDWVSKSEEINHDQSLRINNACKTIEVHTAFKNEKHRDTNNLNENDGEDVFATSHVFSQYTGKNDDQSSNPLTFLTQNQDSRLEEETNGSFSSQSLAQYSPCEMPPSETSQFPVSEESENGTGPSLPETMIGGNKLCLTPGAPGLGGGAKRRGPRTTIKAKQLETLKAAFTATPKPTRHVRESLAQETGLSMRVIQVWFQNRRSKERRMKQLNALGPRRGFYRNPRRLRGIRPGILPSDLINESTVDLLNNPAYHGYLMETNPELFNVLAANAAQASFTSISGGVVHPPLSIHLNNESSLSNELRHTNADLSRAPPFISPYVSPMPFHPPSFCPTSFFNRPGDLKTDVRFSIPSYMSNSHSLCRMQFPNLSSPVNNPHVHEMTTAQISGLSDSTNMLHTQALFQNITHVPQTPFAARSTLCSATPMP